MNLKLKQPVIDNPEIVLSRDSIINNPENEISNKPEICLHSPESSTVHQIINHQP